MVQKKQQLRFQGSPTPIEMTIFVIMVRRVTRETCGHEGGFCHFLTNSFEIKKIELHCSNAYSESGVDPILFSIFRSKMARAVKFGSKIFLSTQASNKIHKKEGKKAQNSQKRSVHATCILSSFSD